MKKSENKNINYQKIAFELEKLVNTEVINFSTYMTYFRKYLMAKFDGNVDVKTMNKIANSLIYCAVIDVDDEELFLASCDTLREDVANYKNEIKKTSKNKK